jgi:DNA-directed RNA polymerase specialized sigma24 family protein
VCSSLSSDDDQIKGLLCGDAKSVAKAIDWIDQNYRYKIGGVLRRAFRGLSSEDLADVWQDSLVDLYRMTCYGTFRREGALAGLLRTLAVRRGQDRIRRNATWHHPIDLLMKNFREPQLRERWQSLDALQRREVVELICAAIERLPSRQKLVWRVYVEHYPSSESLEYLTEEVQKWVALGADELANEESDDAESPVTKKSVSGALYAGRVKIREDLKRKGYDL